MRRLLRAAQIALLFLLFFSPSFAQDNVGIGTTNPRPNALLDLFSNNQGLLVPRVDTTSMAGLGALDHGMIVYDTVVGDLFVWDGTQFQSLSLAGGDTARWGVSGNDIYSLNSGNVGIGTSTPGQLLDVSGGNVNIDLGQAYYQNGAHLLSVSPANQNLRMGPNTGQALTTGTENILFGFNTGNSIQDGSSNIVIGFNALPNNVSGGSNVAIGRLVGLLSTSGAGNVAVGDESNHNNSTGNNNVALGVDALYQNSTGNFNTAIGTGSGVLATSTNLNNATAIGALSIVDSDNSLVLGSINGVGGGTADVSVGIGTATPNQNASLDLGHNDRGLQLNRVDTTSLTLGASDHGMIVYDTVVGEMFVWDGTQFTVVGGSGANDTIPSNVFSARIDNNGVASVISESYPFIQSVNRVSEGNVEIVYVPGFFTVEPVVVSINEGAGFITMMLDQGQTDVTKVRILARRTDNGLVQDRPIHILVQRQGADYQNSLTAPPNVVGYWNPNGSDIYYDTGAVAIGATSVTPGFQLDVVGGDAQINGIRFGIGAGNLTSNVAIGLLSLNSNTTGVNNVAIGQAALQNNLDGFSNIGIGTLALSSNTDGDRNIGIGEGALDNNTTGIENVAVGTAALSANQVGIWNTAVGHTALILNTGSFNSAFGRASLENNVTGAGNAAFGQNSLQNSTGNTNTAMGTDAGDGLTGGSNNTFLGSNSDAGAGTLNNATTVGANSVVGADNSLVLGNGAAVGIGTSIPNQNADLDLGSDDRGLQLNRVDTTSLTLGASDHGMIVYDTVVGEMFVWDGTQFASATNVAAGDTARWGVSGNDIYSLNSGNIGIGTSTPAAGFKLDVVGSDIRVNGLRIGLGTGGIANNLAIGNNALNNNPSGNLNLAIGNTALQSTTTGAGNLAIGTGALIFNTTGNSNIIVGHDAMRNPGSSSQNVGLGTSVMRNGLSGDNNTAIGNTSLQNKTGNSNVALGSSSGNTLVGGNSNTFLGAGADAGIATLNNATAVGANTSVGADNSLVLGNNVAVGIGTSTPNQNASLDLGHDDRGLQLNRVDTTSLTLGASDHGMIVYDTVVGEMFVWDGTQFSQVGSSGAIDTLPANSFSAFIQNNGAASVISEDINFIQSVSYDGLGNTTVNFKPGFFTEIPAITFGSRVDAANHFGQITYTSLSTSSMSVQTRNGIGGATVNVDYSFTANRQGADYQNTLTAPPNVVGYWNPNGSDIYYDTGSVAIGATSVTAGYQLDVVGGDAFINSVTVGRGPGNDISNTALGNQALASNLAGGIHNTAIGQLALSSNTTGTSSTALGYYALRLNTTGYSNVALGHGALDVNTIGFENTAVGTGSMAFNTTGSRNTSFGVQALGANTTGGYNLAIGWEALRSHQSGNYNTGIGNDALRSNISGSNNVAIGAFSSNFTTGGNNTGLGNSSLSGNTTGSNNTAIGFSSDVASGALTNATAIGANTVVGSSNSLVLGNGAAVGIGTSTPNQNADLDLGSDDRGLQLNRVDTTSLTLGASDYGMIVYDTVVNTTFVWNGSNFEELNNTAADSSIWATDGVDIWSKAVVGGIGINTSAPNANYSTTVDNNGRLGGIRINNTYTGGSTQYGLFSNVSNSGSGQKYGIYSNVSGTAGGSNLFGGAYFISPNAGVTNVTGQEVAITNAGTGIRYGFITSVATGATNNSAQYGYRHDMAQAGGGNAYGFYGRMTGAGTGINYGLYLFSSTAGTNDYGVYATGEERNYFSGRVGIGTAAPDASYKLNLATGTGNPGGIIINNTYTGASAQYGIYNNLNNTGTGIKYGIRNLVFGTAGDASTIYGVTNSVTPNGTGTAYGNFTSVTSAGTGFRYGIFSNMASGGTNTSAIWGMRSDIDHSGSGIAYGVYARVIGSSTATTIGLYSTNTSSGTGDFGLYTTGEERNYLSGNVGIGELNPQEKLHITGGTIRFDDFAGNGRNLLTINNTGNVGYVSLSDSILWTNLDGTNISNNNTGAVIIGSDSIKNGKLQITTESNINSLQAWKFQNGNNGTQIRLLRARGTESLPTATQSGDEIASYLGAAYDGTSFGNAGALSMEAAQTWAPGAHGSNMIFETTNLNATVTSQKMTLSSEGYLGIGTTNPANRFAVYEGNSLTTTAVITNEVTGINSVLAGTKGLRVSVYDDIAPGNGVIGIEARVGGGGTAVQTGVLGYADGPGTGNYNRGIAGIAANNSVTNIGVDAFSTGNTGTNYGFRANVGGTQAATKYGYYSTMSGNGVKFGIYSIGEDRNYFSGNVGIGTINPAVELHIQNANAGIQSQVWIENTSTGDAAIAFELPAQLWSMGIDNSDADKFKIASSSLVSSSTAMTIQTDGNVGIGLTNPNYHLHVSSGNLFTGFLMTNTTTGTNNTDGFLITTDQTGDAIIMNNENQEMFFGTNQTTAMTISATQNVGIGTTSPSVSYPLHVRSTTLGGTYIDQAYTGASTQYGLFLNSANTGTGVKYGLYLNLDGTAGDASAIYGERLIIDPFGTGIAYGSQVQISASGTGSRYGYFSNMFNAAGNPSAVFGFRSDIDQDGSGTAYGIYSRLDGSGTGTSYAAYLNNANSGTGDWGVYTTGEERNYMSGVLGLGTTAPTTNYRLHAVGGAADVRTLHSQNTYTGGSPAYGIFSWMTGAGTGTAYALYLNSGSSTSGTEYGVYETGADRNYFSGNVGLGTTTPVNKLDVEGGAVIGATYSGTNTAPSNGLLVQGFVGIGDPSIGFPLEVHGPAGYVISVEKEHVSNTAYVRFMRQGAFVGSITETGGITSYNAFTGSHIAELEGEVDPGILVSFSGEYSKMNELELSEPIYKSHITAKANDPAVLGSYLHEFVEDTFPVEGIKMIMAVGNGFMWVVENGQDLEIGDYLISSDLSGHAMLDKGDFEVSNIIAKVGEPVKWDNVETLIDGVKHKRVTVFFESFTRNHKAEKLAQELELMKDQMEEMSVKNYEIEGDLDIIKAQIQSIMNRKDLEAKRDSGLND